MKTTKKSKQKIYFPAKTGKQLIEYTQTILCDAMYLR